MSKLAELIFFIVWMTGIVVVQGGWPTFFAIIFPPYAFYKAIEHFLFYFGTM